MTASPAFDLLLPGLVAWPLAAAALIRPLSRWRAGIRDGFAIGAVLVTLIGTAALIAPVDAGLRPEIAVPALVGSLAFTVDGFSLVFALLATFVWTAVTWYAVAYLEHDPSRDRYHVTSLAVLGATLGIFLAGNLVTLFLCFELMGLVAYLFVIHAGTDDARQAGAAYLRMTVLAGALLLGGVLMVYALAGTDALAPLPATPGTGTMRWIAVSLLVLGFGIKAGMLPVHTWLPAAHAAAPSPASALLSGVMIKAGAYGVFRTVTALARPDLPAGPEDILWRATATLGLIVLWTGIATMAVGVILALGQHHVKRALAYSSVSQMGFILTGIGVAGYLGPEGGMGLAGGLVHAVNHAILKACFFLGIGAVLFRTGETDLRRLGGLRQRMPVTFGLMLLATAAMAGVPLLNGFVSKCLIHHGLLVAQAREGMASLAVAEQIYKLTCAGTAAVFFRIVARVFLGRPARPWGRDVVEAPRPMLAAMGMLATAMLVLGLRPHLILEGILAPGFATWALPSTAIPTFLGQYFLSPEDLRSAGLILALGALLALGGGRLRLFERRAPAWFGVAWWYDRLGVAGGQCVAWIQREYEIVRHVPFVALGAGSTWGLHQLTGGARLLRGAPDTARAVSTHGRRVALERWDRVLARVHRIWHRLALRSLRDLVGQGWRRVVGALEDVWLVLARESTVLAARLRVERYARDLSVSIALIFVVLLLLLVVVGVGRAR